MAQQQAALAALHALQRLDAAALLGGGAAPPPPLTVEALLAGAAPWTGEAKEVALATISQQPSGSLTSTTLLPSLSLLQTHPML